MPSPQTSSHTVQTNNGKFHSDSLTHRKCHFIFEIVYHPVSMPSLQISSLQLSGNVDISSLLRSGARVSPTQLSDFFNAVFGENYCGYQFPFPGLKFLDLSFQYSQPECGERLAALFFLSTTSGLCLPKRICSFGHSTQGEELSLLGKWEYSPQAEATSRQAD